MRQDRLKELLRKQPFQPFRIFLSNGRTYDIRHPELALVLRDTVIVADPAEDLKPGVGESVHELTLLHINNIEQLPVTTAQKSNGELP